MAEYLRKTSSQTIGDVTLTNIFDGEVKHTAAVVVLRSYDATDRSDWERTARRWGLKCIRVDAQGPQLDTDPRTHKRIVTYQRVYVRVTTDDVTWERILRLRYVERVEWAERRIFGAVGAGEAPRRTEQVAPTPIPTPNDVEHTRLNCAVNLTREKETGALIARPAAERVPAARNGMVLRDGRRI